MQRILFLSASILNTLITSIAGIIITRSYSKLEVGTYMQGVLIFSIVAVVASIGLPKAVYYFGASENKQKHILINIALLLAFSALSCSLIFYFVWPFICSIFSNPVLEKYALIIPIILFFRTVATIFVPVLVTAKKQNMVSLIYGFNSLFQIILISILCYLKASLDYIFFVGLSIEIIQCVCLIYTIFRYTEGKFKGIDIPVLKPITNYSFPLFISIIALILAKKIDGVIVSLFMSPLDYAVFSRGALEVPIGPLIVMNTAALLMPQVVRFFKKDKKIEIVQLLEKEITRMSIMIFPIFVGFLLVHKNFIVLLYSHEYIESTPVFCIYLFLMPIQIYAFDTILQSMNKSITVLYISIISLVINVISSIFLLKIIGITGPAYGTVASGLIATLLFIFTISHYLKISATQWFPIKKLIKIISICGLIWGVGYLVQTYITGSEGIKVVFFFTCYCVFTWGVLWKFGFIEEDDKQTVLSILHING